MNEPQWLMRIERGLAAHFKQPDGAAIGRFTSPAKLPVPFANSPPLPTRTSGTSGAVRRDEGRANVIKG